VRDGDVLERDVEFLRTLEQVGADAVRYSLTLGDEFCGVELRDYGFKDFVTDGGEDTLVIILAKILRLSVSRHCTCTRHGNGFADTHLVDLGQHLDLRSMQHPQR